MKKTFLITVEERPTTRKVTQVRPGSSKRGRPARLVPTSIKDALGISLFGPIGTSKAVEVLAGFPNINQDALQTFIASELQAGRNPFPELAAASEAMADFHEKADKPRAFTMVLALGCRSNQGPFFP